MLLLVKFLDKAVDLQLSGLIGMHLYEFPSVVHCLELNIDLN